MNYEDEIEEVAEVVRAFIVTEGHTVAMSEEFGLETMVSPTAHGLAKLHTMQFERRQILEDFDEPIAIAAIAADVYGPTPGSICSSFKLVGNTPSKSVTIIREHFKRFRALA